jgi:2-(3-amino-3-carboxypropyl)histidine synthase
MLNLAISKLNKNYNFEIYKSIIRIREIAKELNKQRPRVALQMPDGFMLFSILIADILESFAPCECVILGDITYGACCIDDLGSKSLDCDFIVHYGHSCLVPITDTCVKVLYVFVDIQIDINHLVKTIEYNFPEKDMSLCIMGSIQYNNSVFLCKKELAEKGYTGLKIPQTKPRSHGEVLGCTSPIIEEKNILFICDGRFHMESAMIANPDATFYQYNPFTKVLSLEQYDVELMKNIRQNMIAKCKPCKTVGIIFGILGRQGNPDILEVY